MLWPVINIHSASINAGTRIGMSYLCLSLTLCHPVFVLNSITRWQLAWLRALLITYSLRDEQSECPRKETVSCWPNGLSNPGTKNLPMKKLLSQYEYFIPEIFDRGSRTGFFFFFLSSGDHFLIFNKYDMFWSMLTSLSSNKLKHVLTTGCPKDDSNSNP